MLKFPTLHRIVFLWLLVFGLRGQESRIVIRMEPANWWAGMMHSEVEVLFYGKSISDYQVLSSDVPITRVRKTANPNYLFVGVETRGLSAGRYKIMLSKGNKIKETILYELKERKQGSAQRMGFSSRDVIYLLMPDRFSNGDTSNDNRVEMNEKSDRKNNGGRHGGDIAGIISRLDYLNDLGVTALWSTPLCEDNDSTYSYHGYAQSDVYRVDPRYGTNEEYKRLSDELHRRKMKLIMDYVTNHWGLQHWIIKDLPDYDWIHQFPGYGQTNYRTTTQFDEYAAQNDFHYCTDGWFVKTMPDLNQKNELLARYLLQNALWWIEYADLDGFRVDTYSFGDKEAIAYWTKEIMKEYPLFSIVGEVWLHNQAQISYWQKDSRIGEIQGFNSGLPSVMDFTLHDAFMEAFKEKKDSWSSGMIRFYDNFVNDFLYPRADNNLIFFENHDTPRFNEIYPSFSDYQMALTLLLTQRGIPQLYYGSEIGMRGNKDWGDGDIRRDFPGGWKNDTTNAFDALTRDEEQKKYHAFTKKLLNWRKSNIAVQEGRLLQFIPEKNVYVFFRLHSQQSVMVVINNSDKEVKLSLSRFAEVLKNVKLAKEIISGKSVDFSSEHILVPSNSPFIFEF